LSTQGAPTISRTLPSVLSRLSFAEETMTPNVKRFCKCLRTFWFHLTALVLMAGVAWAQKDMGSVVGTVRGSSRALGPGAKVTVTDADRGTTFDTTTNANGEYAANPLHVGRYNVTVEKQGFRKQVIGPVEVNVQARPAVNVTLNVGQISETVTVTSQTPQ